MHVVIIIILCYSLVPQSFMRRWSKFMQKMHASVINEIIEKEDVEKSNQIKSIKANWERSDS